MERVVIMGAAGRDFHDFNVALRGREDREVVAFTRAPGQNLGETDDAPVRCYPAELAGPGYDDGVPIEPEADLESLVRDRDVDTVYFSYSDVSHERVMHAASRALAAGAEFSLLGPETVMLDVDAPVLAVDAVRTGCGKSQVTRALADALDEWGAEPVVVREPMPYGDLAGQRVQRFATTDDLAGATIEEREEYEQHLDGGHVVYAGVDYRDVLDAAADEGDVVVWDGGNNELPFARPDVHLVLVDPLRPADTTTYHPGETNLRLADEVLVNKENSADDDAVERVVTQVRSVNSDARIVHADSVVTVADPDAIEGKRVLVVEDGPTLTHGGTGYGAGTVAAEQYGAAERVDPRPGAVGSIADVLDRYPHLDRVLPAMGYTERQVRDLAATIRNADADAVLAGTPHDLARRVDVDIPVVRASYEVEPRDDSFDALLDRHVDELGL